MAQQDPSEIQLPPSAPPDLPSVCSYESLSSGGTTSGVECFQLCSPGSCCSNLGSCLEGGAGISMDTLDRLRDICMTYQPCE